MAGVLQHLRSSTLNKRPNPASMVDGQIAINYASGSPGAFFKDTNGNLVKVGPVHVGATAPNVSPASGGTAGNSLGEQWLDTSGGTYVFKIWDGAAWRSEAGEFVNSTGDTMTGSLTMGPSANLIFEGSTDDGFETTLTVVDPTADRTITLPNVSGTVVTTGDSGTVTSTMIADGTIVNADVNASAAIAGTKISPDFGSQTIQTTGVFSHALGSASSPTVTFTGDPNTGIYSPGADQVAISTGGSGRLFVDASGRVGIGTSSPGVPLTVQADSNAFANDLIGRAADNTSIIRFKTSDNATALGSIGQYGTTMNINSIGAGPIAFYTTNSERLRITSAGLVGVGTSNPQHLLHLSRSATTDFATIRFSNTGASGREYNLGLGGNGTVIPGAFYLYDETAAAMRILVNSAGNVGIGTTSPGSLLHLSAANNPQLRLTDQFTANTHGYIQEANGTLIIDSQYNNGSGIIAFTRNNNASESARIDSSGRLLVGTSSARANFYNGANTAQIQLEGTNYQNATFAIVCNANSDDKGSLILAKNRGTTVGSNTIVQDGDDLGSIEFQGSDGAEFVQAAAIKAEVDGTPGLNDMPGRLVFSTTADGASSPTERMRIDNKGFTKLSNTGSYVALDCHQLRSDANTINTFINSTNATYTSNVLQVRTTKSGNSDFQLAVFASNDGGDIEFNLRGDGNGLCDGAWTGGGADYAEYFEWSDSNPNAEDRRGISVVLDGDKIREAVAGEDPIGVISGNPSVVGDAAWNKWSGKYLRDEFGTYIQEDYEVADDDGNTVIQQRRKLNPAYDPDVEYISREQRPEWDCVGLMGKLRIRKGQVTGSRWIKMRDISATVEEWLVR